MSELKKVYEKKDQWVKISKVHINDKQKPEYMYLLEWEDKKSSSYDENFYTFYNHALVDFKWKKGQINEFIKTLSN